MVGALPTESNDCVKHLQEPAYFGAANGLFRRLVWPLRRRRPRPQHLWIAGLALAEPDILLSANQQTSGLDPDEPSAEKLNQWLNRTCEWHEQADLTATAIPSGVMARIHLQLAAQRCCRAEFVGGKFSPLTAQAKRSNDHG
ncbi:hypothetical protein [Roseateles noduli]|uniref:hypothetical protein n=1 Tax=Roseateles noduli TaxID=2052484 RepID=UPI003D65766E